MPTERSFAAFFEKARSIDELLHAVASFPRPWDAVAWGMLLTRPVSSDDLYCVFCEGRNPWSQEARKILLRNEPGR